MLGDHCRINPIISNHYHLLLAQTTLAISAVMARRRSCLGRLLLALPVVWLTIIISAFTILNQHGARLPDSLQDDQRSHRRGLEFRAAADDIRPRNQDGELMDEVSTSGCTIFLSTFDTIFLSTFDTTFLSNFDTIFLSIFDTIFLSTLCYIFSTIFCIFEYLILNSEHYIYF